MEKCLFWLTFVLALNLIGNSMSNSLINVETHKEPWVHFGYIPCKPHLASPSHVDCGFSPNVLMA